MRETPQGLTPLITSALRPRLRKEIRPVVLGTLAVIASGIAAVQSTDVFAESITLTIPSTPLSLDVTPTDEGQFNESEEANFSVTTDALASYTLTIKSQNGNNDITNGDDGKIPSITTQISQETAGSSFTSNT